MPNSLSEDNPFRAGVLPETQVLLAGQDLLTGLSSRAGLEAHYRLAVARARRSGARFAVGLAVIDVDPATPADEVFGHDLLMVEAARRLRATLRETDLIARVGETRFAFIAEEVTPAGVGSIVTRVTQALAPAADEARPAGRALVGIALWEHEPQTLAGLLRAAEEVLGAPPPTVPLPDAANAESFGLSADDEPIEADLSRRPGLLRRALGWLSLATLIALAAAGAPPEWRQRWLPLEAAALFEWDALHARWSSLVTTRPAAPAAADARR